MAAIPIAQMAGNPTPSEPGTQAPSQPRDMNYYLTEGLGGARRLQYKGKRSFTELVELQVEKLRSDNANETLCQYIVFSSVTETHLATIERIRDIQYKGHRFMYLKDDKSLIVKTVGGAAHETACEDLSYLFMMVVRRMGLFEDLCWFRAATFPGIGGSNEVDAAFKPLARPRATDRPTMVFVCGTFHSYSRLKAETHWWLENTSGDVKIVILILISQTNQEMRLEQWEMPEPNPDLMEGHSELAPTSPTKTQQVDIVGSTATGESLTLDFQKVFLRKPCSGEGNIIVTAQDLARSANKIWRYVQ